ncbi:MAG: ferredoxin-type protein NapF [Paracoccaceae bacterium]
MSPERRALLRGRFDLPRYPRPIGALAPMAFEEACTQCGDCARACPEGILLRDAEGFPVLDIREGACTFCAACTAACETGALLADQPFPWRAAADERCLSVNGIQCRACEDHCDAQAIRFRLLQGGRSEPRFDTAACTGCGACAAPCPAGAISLQPFSPQQPPMETRPC